MSIYLDNAATTKPCSEAVNAALKAMTENYGNPSSLHRAGLDAQLMLDGARKTIASSIGTESSNIIFTSGATESNNLAIRGICSAYGKRKKKIISSSVEHASVDETLSDMEKQGFEVLRIPPRENGNFYAEDFIKTCDESTVLITMMYVNNETGYILPVQETFNIIKKRFPEIITHTDCVQAYMKLNLKVSRLSADLMSLSGHKVHAAKGTGVLYIKKGIRIIPSVTGGKQERGIRSGTESVPSIASFGAAVEKLSKNIDERYETVSGLKKYLTGRISEIDGIEINSPESSSPYIINISQGKRSEIMLHYLESRGIYISSGSACSKGQQSGVLGQFGITGKRADCALRISMTAETTVQELDEFINALKDGMENLRG
ncbi:MAG: cysteine desulfurase [Ruminococcus sp.]|nr:cysteine desulfurase [Ruminococcus sp.]